MADLTQSTDIMTLLGGAGGTTGTLLLAYHTFISTKLKRDLKDEFSPLITNAKGEALKASEKADKAKEKIKIDREAFNHFMNENKAHIERIDNAESRLEDLSIELKHRIDKNKDRTEDIKAGQNLLEIRLNSSDERERKHYEELSKMSADNKVMDQRLTHIEDEQKEIKLVLLKLTDSVQDLRDAVVKLTAKIDR